MENIDRQEISDLTLEYGGEWGINHTQRLLHLISIIGRDVTYDEDVVWVAAHLHDWGGYSKWAQSGVDHAVRSRQVAEAFLKERNFPQEFIQHVLECIEFHHNGNPSKSIEAILLSDADALDFLGVVGVLRDFAKKPKDLRNAYETAKSRKEKLPGSLCLMASKIIGLKRLKESESLLAQFEEETFGYF